MPNAAAAVQLDRVTKTFGPQVAVDDLSLAVPSGSVYGFIGPNGSGKTTTLRMIMRIIMPDRGGIRVLDDERENVLDLVSYLPEERMLYKQMKVFEVLRFFARLKGVNPTRKQIDDWLDRLNLPGVAEKKVETLSKGMTQKVQLVATLISEPKLVLLDEPFSGLDPVNAVVLRDTILDMRKRGTTVIFSTHDMAVAERMCDFIFMIYKGKKVLDGSMRSIHQTYGTDVIHVRIEPQANGNASPLMENLPGVVKVTDLGNVQELRTTAGTDQQALLAELMRRGRVTHFEVAHPSLHDIFVRIASPDQVVPKGETVLA